jgi:hypothetical protein
MRCKLTFSLGQYTTAFQAEVYTIKVYAPVNIKRGYWRRKHLHVYIHSDSHAAITALDNCKINSKLVWDCHQSLMILAEHNNVHLLWVLGKDGLKVTKPDGKKGSAHIYRT